LGVCKFLGVERASQHFPMTGENVQELVAGKVTVAMRESDSTVELRIVPKSLVDAGHPDEDNCDLLAVMTVAK